jgi:hypothetical protein
MPNATVRANARTLSGATNRRAILGAVLTAGAAVGLPTASAPIAPAAPASLTSISPELRAAIDAHRLAQANVDGHPGQPEEEFSALSDVEGQAHQTLAETPCATDAEFIAKIAYLLRHERHLWGELLSEDGQYGKLAFAIELHLEERDEWRAFFANAAGQSA